VVGEEVLYKYKWAKMKRNVVAQICVAQFGEGYFRVIIGNLLKIVYQTKI
jgi:protoporphyrinogen oxidase